MALIDSNTWKDRAVKLNQLQFHPNNPRLPEIHGKTSEREIIQELCKRKVDVLARSIADKGYFLNDRPVVVQEGRKYIVYEGNRRLCALKLLANPDLAPKSKFRLFEKLAANAKLPGKIPVVIVPTRFDAEVVMYAKHASENFSINWKPLQQATFIATKLDGGDSVEDMERFGFTRKDVIQAKAAVDLYRIARLADLPPTAKKLIDDPEDFPYSIVFERLFQPKPTREALGVEITSKGLQVNSSKERFFPILGRILEDVVTDKINTRSLGTIDDQLAYVESLSFEPGGGKFTLNDLEKGKENPANTTDTGKDSKPDPRPKARKPTGRIFPRDLESFHEHEKLHRILNEGKKLEIKGAAHAAALLLRTLLETALIVRLKAQPKHWQAARSMEKNPKHGPGLALLLDYVNKNADAFGLDPHAKIALSALVSRKIKHSKPTLDGIVHTPEVIATEETVYEIREQAVPILKELLRRP